MNWWKPLTSTTNRPGADRLQTQRATRESSGTNPPREPGTQGLDPSAAQVVGSPTSKTLRTGVLARGCTAREASGRRFLTSLPVSRRRGSLTSPSDGRSGCSIPPDPAAQAGPRFRSSMTRISASGSSALLSAARATLRSAAFAVSWLPPGPPRSRVPRGAGKVLRRTRYSSRRHGRARRAHRALGCVQSELISGRTCSPTIRTCSPRSGKPSMSIPAQAFNVNGSVNETSAWLRPAGA